jgi:NTE family protein
MDAEQPKKKPCIGLILAGGGARAAYQVGVLKAVLEIVPKEEGNPFPVICGTSAGAINGAVLAIHGARFGLGVRRLVRMWKNFTVSQIFRADALGVAKSGAHWMAAMMLGGLGKYNPHSLFDRTPLRELLDRYVPCERIQQSIDSGAVRAFSVSASGYTSGQSITFYQGDGDIKPWFRARRIGCPGVITREHLLASSAIPFVFSATRINREYFGDGSMRQVAPISPALHLGADRVLVIGVRRDTPEPERAKTQDYPSMAQVAGHVLDSIFLDSLETDLERLRRINKTIRLIPDHHLEEGNVSLRHVDVLMISPSANIQEIAARHMHEMPWALRLLLRGIGAFKRNGSSLVSYLLFEKGYCRELIQLGYSDALEKREAIREFMGVTATRAHDPDEASQPAPDTNTVS